MRLSGRIFRFLSTFALLSLSGTKASAQFVPPDVAAAQITELQWQRAIARLGSQEAVIREMASQSGAPDKVLLQFAYRLQKRYPGRTPAQILDQVNGQLATIKSLRDTLAARNGENTSEMEALRRQASRAFDRGDVQQADLLLRRVTDMRRAAIAARRASEKGADDKARADLVRDMTERASILASGTDFDQSIAVWTCNGFVPVA
jgi:hypothetical protein